MTTITSGQARSILTGTELGGNAQKAYHVTLAVPNRLLGISPGGNRSGFSFGVVQLDIANNDFARAAYRHVLDLAKTAGQVTEAQHDHLAAYITIPRPDLNPATKGVYAADRTLLNTLFASAPAQAAVDDQTDAYLEQSLVPKVNAFLAQMDARYGSSSVFHPQHPDHRLAFAAVTSTANRTGGLGSSATFYLATAPSQIAVVQSHFVGQFQASDWSLVQTGATMLQQFDASHPAG